MRSRCAHGFWAQDGRVSGRGTRQGESLPRAPPGCRPRVRVNDTEFECAECVDVYVANQQQQSKLPDVEGTRAQHENNDDMPHDITRNFKYTGVPSKGKLAKVKVTCPLPPILPIGTPLPTLRKTTLLSHRTPKRHLVAQFVKHRNIRTIPRRIAQQAASSPTLLGR